MSLSQNYHVMVIPANTNSTENVSIWTDFYYEGRKIKVNRSNGGGYNTENFYYLNVYYVSPLSLREEISHGRAEVAITWN